MEAPTPRPGVSEDGPPHEVAWSPLSPALITRPTTLVSANSSLYSHRPYLPEQLPRPPIHRPSGRQRIGLACDKCRDRKTKCSGGKPLCTRCASRGLICHYTPPEARIRGSKRPRMHSAAPVTPVLPLESPPRTQTFRQHSWDPPSTIPIMEETLFWDSDADLDAVSYTFPEDLAFARYLATDRRVETSRLPTLPMLDMQILDAMHARQPCLPHASEQDAFSTTFRFSAGASGSPTESSWDSQSCIKPGSSEAAVDSPSTYSPRSSSVSRPQSSRLNIPTFPEGDQPSCSPGSSSSDSPFPSTQTLMECPLDASSSPQYYSSFLEPIRTGLSAFSAQHFLQRQQFLVDHADLHSATAVEPKIVIGHPHTPSHGSILYPCEK